MADGLDEFVAAAPGIAAAEGEREGGPLHVYRGELEDGTPTRILTPAPDVADEVGEAFTRAAGQWQNASTHPNIVGVYERGDEPRPWLAVERVQGQPLDVAQPSLSLRAAATVVEDAAEAVRNAGLYNTTHLDLSPEHVWVVGEGEDVRGLVGDWGIERAVRTAAGQERVTPFTAPELLAGEQGSEQTDVYGLGATAYFALTGQPPFAGATDLKEAIREGDPRPPSEVESALPAAVDDVILRALAVDPEDRHPSSYDFRRTFAGAVSDHPAFAPGAGGTEGAVEADEATETEGASGAAAADAETETAAEAETEGETEAEASAAEADTETGESADADSAEPDDGRRDVLKLLVGSGVAIGAGALAATQLQDSGGSGGDGGDGGGGGGDGSTAQTATATEEPLQTVDYGGYLDGVSNYEGRTVDKTGQDEVIVKVGAEGNGGNFAFSPPAVHVDPGATVVWEWTGLGGQHNVVSEAGLFESPLRDEEGATFAHTFDEEAIYLYHCAPHESLGMRGAVAVGEAPLQTAEQAGVSGDENRVRIGVLQPLSDSLQPYGLAALHGFYSGLKYKGDSETTIPGPEATDGNYEVQVGDLTYDLLVRDTKQFSPEVAQKRATELVESENVDVLAGVTSSASALRVADIAESAGVPFVVAPASATPLTADANYCNEYVFRTAETTAMSALAGGKYLADEPDVDSVWIYHADFSLGQEIKRYYTKALEGSTTTVEGSTAIPPGYDEDWPGRLEPAQEAGVDAAVAGLTVGTLPAMVRVFAANPDRYDFSLTGKFTTRVGVQMVGRALEDALGSVTSEALERIGFGPFVTRYHWNQYDNAINDAFVDVHTERYGYYPDLFGSGAFTAASAIDQAVRAAGSSERDAIARALRGMTVEATPKGKGAYEFQTYNNQARSPMTVADPVPTSKEASEYWQFDGETLPYMPGAPAKRLGKDGTTLGPGDESMNCSL